MTDLKVLREDRNDKGCIYGICIETTDNGQFVCDLWNAVSSDGPHDVNDAWKEWTDRTRDFRTTISQCWGVYIRTHAWHPQGDKKELHPDVLRFLETRGISVKK